MKTQAVVFAEPNRVEIRDMETPDPGPDQVGIRTVFGAGRTASGS
jgi:D-arabinose 1-dehydrogenase-like Zn-dependent alcohol dehydrogenase